MPDKTKHLQKLLKIHQKNLEQLELQASKYGPLNVPIHIGNQIEEEKKEIARIERQIGKPIARKSQFRDLENAKEQENLYGETSTADLRMPTMQDFEVRIGQKQSDGTYEVTAKSETGGRASGRFQPLWTDEEIEEDLKKIERCIYDNLSKPGEDLAKKLGSQFYQALLGSREDSINPFFERCIGIAEAQNSGLRIRLWIEDYELRRLPWEFLYRTKDSRFLATAHNFAIVRYEENQAMQRDLKANLPLKILIITANPEEEPQKRVKRIISNVFNSYKDKFTPTFLDSPTITDLKKRLLQSQFQVIDFIGHGSLETDKRCYLILGNNQLIGSTEFRDLIGGNDTRLIILNPCYTGVASRDPFLSIGSALTRGGIPAVIAMQYAMPFKSTEVFSDIFYTALANFLPIDQCITQARITISANLGEDTVDWAIPALFMNARDGVILEKDEKKEISKKGIQIVEREKVDLNTLREKYLNYLKEKYSQMSFKGLSEGKLLSFKLKDIYTNLFFSEELPSDRIEYLKKKEERGKIDFIREIKERKPKTLSETLNPQYSVITGDPGAGKSTILKYIALAYVDNQVNKRLGAGEGMFPIIFPIVAYAEECKKVNTVSYSLNEFLPEYYKGLGLPDLTPLFNEALKRHRALFLIDGLDEVADETERKRMVEDIRNFMISNDHSENRYIITCRTASYTKATRFEKVKGKEFSHYTVLPFDIEQIKDFLFKWYCYYEKEINKRFETFETEARKDTDKMISVIEGDKNILSIATNPLMLTILALIEHEGGELPKNRADLYAKCLKMLAGLWDKQRSLYEVRKPEFSLGTRKITEDFVVDFLGPIAYEMHENASPKIEYDDLKERLAKKFNQRNKDLLLSKEQADDFIQIMKERSGILQEVSPGVYGFMHLTFKEYLTARVLTDLSENRIKHLGENIFKPEWREVVFLTASSLKKRDASDFIREIFERETKHFENLILAGECVKDTGRDKIDDELYDLIIERLKSVLEGDYLVNDKVAVGEILGWLGDPRDLKEFIPVKAGEYRLKELGKFPIKPFEIGKYPVTNIWFEEFIKDGGYNNPEYWGDEGKKWLADTRAKEPRLWNDREWKCPNSPVVGVSWYEAYAFTRWLTIKRDDKYEYRLPDENEWQASAGGFEGREYPWGNKWEENRCNTYDSRIQRTSPVGIFKNGDTPEGISDLSGNVWEWTKSDYHSKEKLKDFKFDEEMQKLLDKDSWDDYFSRLDEKDRQLPVLRGGSWFDSRGVARCAYRNGGSPEFRDSDVGFRCVRTSCLAADR